MLPAELATERLTLRRWRETDREPFAAMNADAEVMEHLPAPLTRAQSDAFVDRIDRHFAQHGFGLWAVDLRDRCQFIGFVGLSKPNFHADWMDTRPQPVVEVGWRLSRPAWGHGYATEGARAAVAFAFDAVGLTEIVSFTVVGNLRSQAVMRRIGMTRLVGYDHPVAGGEALPSVVYALVAEI